MIPQNYQFQDQSLRRAHSEGKAEGKANGLAQAVLAVLRLRGLNPLERERDGIERCLDIALLRKWHAAALTAASVAEVLEGT